MNFLELLDLTLYPATAFIVGMLTVILGRNTSRISISKERLEKVYHPLFLSIEPYLYKNVTYEEISPFIDCYYALEKDFSLFIHPSLRQEMKYICDRKKLLAGDKHSEDDWTIVCDYVSNEYDRLCKHAYIPIRNTAYRLNYNQYKSKLSMYLGMLWINLPAILFFGLAFTILLMHAF